MEIASESFATMHAFLEGRIPEQKMTIAGALEEKRLFPKVLLPAHQCATSHDWKGGIADVTHIIRNNRDWIQHQLTDHGALLFRGFPVRSAADFSSFVKAFGWEEQRYKGFAPRKKVDDCVYTANETPLHEQIGFHHEMAWMDEWPSKLFFFCETAPPTGGETAIALSQGIAQRMEDRMPEFVRRVKDTGLVLSIVMAPTLNTSASFSAGNWQAFLETNDPNEAKKRAVEVMGCTNFNCLEDGSAEFVFGPREAIRAFEGYGGRRVWFNTITGYGERNLSLSFGDGCHISGEAAEAFKAIVDEECVNLRWEEGDVLLLDNLVVQHARRPSKPPRKVLVAMCK